MNKMKKSNTLIKRKVHPDLTIGESQQLMSVIVNDSQQASIIPGLKRLLFSIKTLIICKSKIVYLTYSTILPLFPTKTSLIFRKNLTIMGRINPYSLPTTRIFMKSKTMLLKKNNKFISSVLILPDKSPPILKSNYYLLLPPKMISIIISSLNSKKIIYPPKEHLLQDSISYSQYILKFH